MPPDHPVVPLDAKLDHLRQAASYPVRPGVVETKETHMSWVFLAGDVAYKLKKPIKNSYNWRTIEARRADCRCEVDLNRRLAEDVYYGIVPLTIDAGGQLCLEGEAQPVDWLVKMRRLPESRMLDWLIEHDRVDIADFRRALTMLCRFYQQSLPLEISPRAYRDHLIKDLEQSSYELALPQFGQSEILVQQVHQALRAYVERASRQLDQRVESGRVIDAHGDLRPEHICLESPPVIIDCLQFDPRLRILDAASELSFLALECERLGAVQLVETIWSVYRRMCNDQPPEKLLRFYTAYHACLLAMVSVWHLKDDVDDAAKWTSKADRYLHIAEQSIEQKPRL